MPLPPISQDVQNFLNQNNINPNSATSWGGVSSPSLPAIPSSSNQSNYGPPIQQVFIAPDPTQKIKIKVPGQPNLPETEMWDPNYIASLKQQSHATDNSKFNGQNSQAIDLQYKQYEPNPNQQQIYDLYKNTVQGGTIAKKGFEGFLTQFLQIPQDIVGAIPGDILNLKAMAVNNPQFQKVNPDAYNYEAQKNAYAPQLKEALGANGLRLNIPEINNMAQLLPSVSNDPETNKKNVLTINTILYNRFGTMIDANILDKYGITKQEVLDRIQGNAPKNQEKNNEQQPKSMPTTFSNIPPLDNNSQMPPITGGFMAEKNNKAFSYMSDSNNLAKQAMAEADPQKKADLLAQSRLLQNMANESNDRNPKVNSLTDKLAKIQKFLGSSEALPATSAMMGQAILPIPGVGAGVGAYFGEKGKQALNAGGLQAFLPSSVKDNEAMKNAFNYGALDLILFGAGKLLHPIKTVTDMRSAAATAATKEGAVINGDDIVEGVKKWVYGDSIPSSIQSGQMPLTTSGGSGVPASLRDQAVKFYEDIMSKYAGKILTVDQGLADKTASWGVSNAARGGQFEVGKTALKQGEAVVANLIRDQLPQTVKNYDKILSLLYSGQNLVGGTVKNAIKYGPAAAVGLAGEQFLSNKLLGK